MPYAENMDIAAINALTPKQRLFVDHILLGKSAAQAHIDAGYSVRCAHVEGPRTLSKPAVEAEILRRRAPLEIKTQNIQERILEELEAMAFANIEDLTSLNDDGHRDVDMSNATRAQLASVTKIVNKTRKVYNAKGDHIATEEQRGFTLADKYRGLELLGKHAGLFKNEDQRVVVDVADRLLEARQRIQALADRTAED